MDRVIRWPNHTLTKINSSMVVVAANRLCYTVTLPKDKNTIHIVRTHSYSVSISCKLMCSCPLGKIQACEDACSFPALKVGQTMVTESSGVGIQNPGEGKTVRSSKPVGRSSSGATIARGEFHCT